MVKSVVTIEHGSHWRPQTPLQLPASTVLPALIPSVLTSRKRRLRVCEDSLSHSRELYNHPPASQGIETAQHGRRATFWSHRETPHHNRTCWYVSLVLAARAVKRYVNDADSRRCDNKRYHRLNPQQLHQCRHRPLCPFQ